MVLDDEKMSKSLGNPELVSRLWAWGIEPVVARATILTHHHRLDWEWSERILADAQAQVARWHTALDGPHAAASVAVLDAVYVVLSDDLDAPRALEILDAWAAGILPGLIGAVADPIPVIDIVAALLGPRLRWSRRARPGVSARRVCVDSTRAPV